MRFIGNFSSGKMGIALANTLVSEGAEVNLVAGPIDTGSLNPSTNLIKVESALEMYEACMDLFPDADIAIMNAAVADFRPANPSDRKIKRSSSDLILELVPNPDIAASLGEIKTRNQILVGFALETEEGIGEAQNKMKRKKLDMIVLNSLQDKGAGFGGDTNRISIILKDNIVRKFELKKKKEVAQDIIDVIFAIFER